MDERWLDCFSHSGGRACTFHGTHADGRFYGGSLASGAVAVAVVHEGVANFTAPPDPWTARVDGLARDGWIPRNWERGHRVGARNGEDPGAVIAEELAAIGGPICEIAAGPGGGFVPSVRRLNAAARVMLNDRSPGVLALWRHFLPARGLALTPGRPSFRLVVK